MLINYRSLYRKRKELAGLKEETSSLHAQLKAKRRNLQTLEKLLKEASQMKEAAEVAEQPRRTNDYTTFMIACPDGTFVELTEVPQTTIRRVVAELKMALTVDQAQSKSNGNVPFDLAQPFRLYLKGKLMHMDATLEQCGVRNGDTMVVSMDQRSCTISQTAPMVKEVIIQENKSMNLDGISEVVEMQIEGMKRLAEEVK